MVVFSGGRRGIDKASIERFDRIAVGDAKEQEMPFEE